MAIYFDEDFLTAASITIPDTVTVCMWAYLKQRPAADVYARFFGSDANFEVFEYKNSYEFANELFDDQNHRTSAVLPLNEWIHLGATANRSTGAYTIYLNGGLDGSGTGHTEVVTTPDTMGIGCRDGIAQPCLAILEQVRFYNAVLSAKQIYEVYMSSIMNYELDTLTNLWITRTHGGAGSLRVDVDRIIDPVNKSVATVNGSGNAWYYGGRAKLRR